MVYLLLDYACSIRPDASSDIEKISGSLLHIACDACNFPMVRILVEKGKYPINIKDQFGIQPIHIACTKDNLQLVKYLYKHKADISAMDAMGNVPLGYAQMYNAKSTIEYLLSHHALNKEFKILSQSDQVVMNTKNFNSKKLPITIRNPNGFIKSHKFGRSKSNNCNINSLVRITNSDDKYIIKL
jgi:ankyrin repeat protein